MTAVDAPFKILCNGARTRKRSRGKPLVLEYRDSTQSRNVTLELPRFIRNVGHLPNRILDLLEIAAYVFIADRNCLRGRKDAVEYHSWARDLDFTTKVRDAKFWKQEGVTNALTNALRWMSGDENYHFQFQPGHHTPPTSLFDREDVAHTLSPGDTDIVLFSGGLDSITGVIDMLQKSNRHICLVSHQSQSGTVATQNQLFDLLSQQYPGRVSHYAFRCTLHGSRAREESQRTRVFLYCAIAFAIAHAMQTNRIFVFENGITSLNFARRQTLMNARASRTTHPRTLILLSSFLSLVAGKPFEIVSPFADFTKTDVIKLLLSHGRKDLITSTVSCTKTFTNIEQNTHCGGCSQCIDRRFAAYAAGVGDIDSGSGLYYLDFNTQPVDDPEVRTTLIDYVRWAHDYATWNLDHFHDKMISDLAYTIDESSVQPMSIVESIWKLHRRHGEQVLDAIHAMRDAHDSVYTQTVEKSFMSLIAAREHFRTPVERLVNSIITRMTTAIPLAYQSKRPADENNLNDTIEALLAADAEKLTREFPILKFGIARTKPDHSTENHDLFIESKYLRQGTTPSKATEGIAADLTKYPEYSHILFIVYDPDRSISDDAAFKSPFERRGRRCTIAIIR